MPHPTSRVALLGLALLAALLSGFVSAPKTALLGMPEGISIDVYQARMDVADHVIEVAIRNDSKNLLTVKQASFESDVYPKTAYTKVPTMVLAGNTTTLRIQLPAANCENKSGGERITLSYEVNGTEGKATVPVKDRMNQLPAIVADDCRSEAIAKVSTVSIADSLSYSTIDGEKVAVIKFTFTPTGKKGTLVFEDVRGTDLLSMRDPQSRVVVDTLHLGLNLGETTTPTNMDIYVAPARCDPHAVLEDKQGTIFRFHVTTDDGTGLLYQKVPDDVRTELYDYVAEVCNYS